MTAARADVWVTAEEYLARERRAETKSEYLDGRIVAMAGASRTHNFIVGDVFGELREQLRGTPCELFASDMRVRIPATGRYVYPDVVVACGDIQFEDAAVDTLLTPVVIVEVLSPATEAYDRGEKFAHYRTLPSLQEYVLVGADRPSVEHYLRQGEQWLLTAVTDLDGVVQLPTIGCALRLRDIYQRVPFGTQQ